MTKQKISKMIAIGNIISMKKDNSLVLVDKTNNMNIVDEFYFHDQSNQKAIRKFIKKVESEVRKSNEYSHYIGYLNNEMNIHRDAVKGNITDATATLEFHHYPFTLYDIVEIVLNKHIMEDDKFTTFTIINEVLQLHYQNKVGLVKLSKTMHKLVHSGELYVPMDSIFGNVNEFINDYYDYIFDDLIEKYNELVRMNEMTKKE